MNEEQGQAQSQRGDTGQLLTLLYCWGPHQGRAGQQPRARTGVHRGCTARLSAGMETVGGSGKRAPSPCLGLRETGWAQSRAEVASGQVLPVAYEPVGKRKQRGALGSPAGG